MCTPCMGGCGVGGAETRPGTGVNTRVGLNSAIFDAGGLRQHVSGSMRAQGKGIAMQG